MTINSKIISEETAFYSKYFRVIQKRIERNDKIFTKDFIERNPAVFVLPITKKREIYLLKQYRDTFQKVCLEVVAGNMESMADNPLETVKRELQEETGFTANHWQKIAELELNMNMWAKLHIFVATDLIAGSATPDEDESIEMIKMPFEEAVQKTMNGHFIAASHVASILLLERLLANGTITC